jgi:hypothetical protein
VIRLNQYRKGFLIWFWGLDCRGIFKYTLNRAYSDEWGPTRFRRMRQTKNPKDATPDRQSSRAVVPLPPALCLCSRVRRACVSRAAYRSPYELTLALHDAASNPRGDSRGRNPTVSATVMPAIARACRSSVPPGRISHPFFFFRLCFFAT